MPRLLFSYPYPTIDADIVVDESGMYHLFLIHGEDRMAYYVVNIRLLTFMTKVNGHWLKEECSLMRLLRKVLVSILWLEEVGCWCTIALKVDSANFAGVMT